MLVNLKILNCGFEKEKGRSLIAFHFAFHQNALHNEKNNTPTNTNRPTGFYLILTTTRMMDGFMTPHLYRQPCVGSTRGSYRFHPGCGLRFASI